MADSIDVMKASFNSKSDKKQAASEYNQKTTRFQQMDFFSQQVNMTWSGNESFQTNFGASISVIIIVCTIVVFGIKCSLLNTPEQQYYMQSTAFNSPTTLDSTIQVDPIDFKFNLFNRTNPFQNLDSSRFGKFSLVQKQKLKISIGGSQQVKEVDVSNVTCPYQKNEQVKSLTFTNQDYQNVYELQLQTCVNSTATILQNPCATLEDQSAWIRDTVVRFQVSDQIFNALDLQEQFLTRKQEFQFSLFDKRTVKKTLSIQFNCAFLKDSLFGFLHMVKEMNYLSLSNYIETDNYNQASIIVDSDPIVALIEIKMTSKQEIFKRQSYSLCGVMQEIGGFYCSIYFLGLIICARLQKNLLNGQLMNRLYHEEYQEVKEKQIEKQATISAQQVMPEPEIAGAGTGDNFQNKLFTQFEQKFKKTHTDIFEEIKHRLQFRASKSILIAYTYFSSCKCCFQKPSQQRIKLIENGIQRINKELDAIDIIRRLRKIELLVNAVFSKHEQVLMEYQKSYLIKIPNGNKKLNEQNQTPRLVRKMTVEEKFQENASKVQGAINKIMRSKTFQKKQQLVLEGAIKSGSQHKIQRDDLFQQKEKVQLLSLFGPANIIDFQKPFTDLNSVTADRRPLYLDGREDSLTGLKHDEVDREVYLKGLIEELKEDN